MRSSARAARIVAAIANALLVTIPLAMYYLSVSGVISSEAGWVVLPAVAPYLLLVGQFKLEPLVSGLPLHKTTAFGYVASLLIIYCATFVIAGVAKALLLLNRRDP